MLPKTTVEVGAARPRKLLRLMDALDEQDDVDQVHANFDIPGGPRAASPAGSLPGPPATSIVAESSMCSSPLSLPGLMGTTKL